MAFRSIVVLTGAGLSVESGLGTFRDKDGLSPKASHAIRRACTISTISAAGCMAG